MGNERKYQSSSISHIQNPWKKLEVLIWQCINQDEIIRKIGGEEADKVDLQNSFRNFLRFDERTYEADPKERIRFFFNNMWGYNALFYLGIPEKEYGGYTNEQVINRITRELGFKDVSVQPPKGIPDFLNKACTSISRAEEHPKDKDQVIGACVNIFRLLERIFKETLYVYAYWRFRCELQYTGLSVEQQMDIPVLRRVDAISVSENKYETHTQEHQAIDDIQNQDDFADELTGKFLTKWIVQNRLKEKIKNDRVTLGDYRTIFYDIDKLIHEEDAERNRFVNVFRRSFLLMPISANNYIDIPLPDTLNYAELRNSIKGRNVIIHYKLNDKDIKKDALDLMKNIYIFMEHIKNKNIFPKIVSQKCFLQYDDGTNRIRLHGDDGELFHLFRDEPLEFGVEYYLLGTYPERTFIKRPQNDEEWNEILK